MTKSEVWTNEIEPHIPTIGEIENWPVGDEDRREPSTMGELWDIGEDW